MSYTIDRFGSIALPCAAAEEPVGTAPSRSGLVTLPGGYYDAYGSERAPREREIISRKAILHRSTPALLQAAYNELRAMRGVRSNLYMTQPDGSVYWTTARLLKIVSPSGPDNIRHLELTMTFELIEPVWHGERTGSGWVLDAGEVLDAGLTLDESDGVTVLNTSPKNVTVINGGNATVKNAVITVTAVGTDITSLIIAKSGETQLVYSGTIAVGESLVIDCGAWSVENDGADDYANFDLGASHAIEEWLHLDPGSNTITVTRTGGANSTIGFTFYDLWE